MKKTTTNGISFSQACEYLSMSPDQFVALRNQGLIASQLRGNKQVYPNIGLNITQQLLKLGQERGWGYDTLAWYADLAFSAEIGHAILLPLSSEKAAPGSTDDNWLGTPYAAPVLAALAEGFGRTDSAITAPLRSLVAFALGEDRFWPELTDLQRSTLYPIIAHLETGGTSIIDQSQAVARDAGATLVSMMFAFTTLAPSISGELLHLVQDSVAKLKGSQTVNEDDPQRISREGLVAVDKLYASKANEIHTPPEIWDMKLGLITAQKRTITLEMQTTPESTGEIVDNIIDIIRPYVGPFGARVVHLLYETANDSPYWRNPLITIETNELLDRLGITRDQHGYHRSKNRERLRDVLNTAHNMEIVGEYSTWEDGQQVRKALRRTVLSLIGATFDAAENEGLSTADLFRRGLPKSLQIRLNFYDGVRKPDGRLGNQYVLVPRLPATALPSARHSATEELLKAYLLVRYRQTRMESRTLTITRGTALEKADITTKNITRATQILTRALEKLVTEGTVESYSPVPLRPHQTFTVKLSAESAG